ncbi:MAG: MmgE/PrpD family protein [Armatimonadota bacterium]|nr:MmgE/PrpD family protein [Armatimonadota bacterium]
MPGSSIERLAHFAAGVAFGALPPEVVERARASLLDGIGCILGAWSLPEGRWIAERTEAVGGTPEAIIPGGSIAVPVGPAAYAAGTMINLLDFDDTAPMAGHPGAAVLPAVLAVVGLRSHGKECGRTPVGVPADVSGSDLLVALVAGYEVALRIAAAGRPTADREARIRGHGTWQAFGAAAAAGRLLGLDATQMANALALAALHAPIPFVGRWYQRPVGTLKNNYGWVALGGVQSAMLAAAGWRGNLNVLDGPGGFWEMAGSDRWAEEAIGDGLGTTFQMLQVGHKTYPACWHLGAALGALERILRQGSLASHQVCRVRIASVDRITNFTDWTPTTPYDAQFSLPYTAAMILLGVPPGPEWFAADRLTAGDVRSQMAKIAVVVDKDMRSDLPGRTPARVTVETVTGKSWTEEASHPPGDPSAPLSWDQVASKFVRLAALRLGPEEAAGVVQWCGRLGAPDSEHLVGPALSMER